MFTLKKYDWMYLFNSWEFNNCRSKIELNKEVWKLKTWKYDKFWKDLSQQ